MADLRKESQLAALRRQAEQWLGQSIKHIVPNLKPKNVKALVQELQVHQVELEMQCEELERAQSELAESRDTYRELYESIPVGYVTLDRHGGMYDVNPTAKVLLQIDASSHSIQNFNAYLSDKEVNRFVMFCRRVIATQTADVTELELKRLNQSVFPAAVQAAPVKSGKDKVNRLRMTFTDLTHRKEAEETLHRQHLELEANRAELQALTRKLFTVQEDERKRIARDLHDDYCQRVTALILEVNMLKKACERTASSLVPRLTAMSHKLSGILNDFRTLSHELLPRSLGDTSLAVSIRHLVKEFSDKAGFEIKFFEQAVPRNIQSGTMTTIFRLLQESLCNIMKHANAKHVTVTLAGTAQGGIELVLVDDGVGFDTTRAWDGQKGMGIVSMRERIRLAGGTFKIISQPGQGTTVISVLPGREVTDARLYDTPARY
ncbi:MAG: PAS domain S-box protein [Nitrospira sp.]|nr:PAS domain S-box protein [Nitrospira sp.]